MYTELIIAQADDLFRPFSDNSKTEQAYHPATRTPLLPQTCFEVAKEKIALRSIL
jgi:hypothetical protein